MSKKLIYLLSFLLMLCLVNNATADLVAHYKFDGDATDSSGNGHHGTEVGAPTYVSGVFDQAIEFDGSSYVDCGTDPAFDITNEITVAAWIKLDHVDDRQSIVNKESNEVRGIGYRVETGGTVRVQLYVQGWQAPEDKTDLESTASLQPDTWYHVAYTYEFVADGTSKTRLYIDGQEESRTDTTVGPLVTNTEPLEIGRYYWSTGYSRWFDGLIDDVRIYSRALTQEEIEEVMKGISPALASNPSPAYEATDVPLDVVLSWTPGIFAPPTNGHKVYFSENFNEVNDGIGDITQDANSYAPSQRLDFSTTYYWRIDEANSTTGWDEGEVWQFTTEPIAYPIDGNNITATASSQAENQGPENTVDGSGLDVNDLHSTEATDMWLSGEEKEPNRAWIEYKLDKVYKLHQMWVWNSNEAWESNLGLGFKDVSVEYLVNGTDYTILAGVPEFAQAPGTSDCEHNTTVDFGSVAAMYVRLTANSNWGGLDQYGLSEVQFFSIPVFARKPYPDSGATDVSIGTIDEPVDVTLGWRAGREAVMHDVHLSSDKQAVIDSNALVATVTETSFSPLSLDLGTTYYWKINEVNEAETTTTWQGDIWNFTTTPEFFIVDDFELYNDIHPDDPNSNRIFNTWIDGYYNPETNGSIVGYANSPFAEQTIVHAGLQSMPLLYDNSGPANYSEATLTLPAPRDWTKHGIGELSLWFRGNPASVSSFTEGPVGAYTMTATGDDIWNDADQFHYAYKRFSGFGTIVAKVLSVSNTHSWAKAGVMIRETLDPGSAHVMALVTPGQGVNLTYRSAAGDTSNSTGQQTGITAPHWVRLTRSGSTFTAYHSTDGTTWDTLGSGSIAMPSDVYIGLALTSHNTDPTVACTATFSDVTITGTVTGQWQSQDIGITSNDVEQLYVAVEDSTGKSKVVNHLDPNAVQSGTYREWNIDLKQVSAAGVNLASIKKIYIGVGDRDAPKLGGGGMLYIDDIRLYPYSRQLITPVEPNQANLVGHWKFDEGSGTIAFDLSGNDHHATLKGGVSWAGEGSPVNGDALSFDGYSDGVSHTTDPGTINWVSVDPFDVVGPGITLAAWIRPDGFDIGDARIVTKQETWSSSDIWWMLSTYTDGTALRMRLKTDDGGADNGTTTMFSDTGYLQLGVWSHAAATYDGSKMRLYHNGVEIMSTDKTGTIQTDPTAAVAIGNGPLGDPGGLRATFHGLIDEVLICNQALSVAEIAWLAGRTEPFPKPF